MRGRANALTYSERQSKRNLEELYKSIWKKAGRGSFGVGEAEKGQKVENIFPETFDNNLPKIHESSQQEYEPRSQLRKKQFIQV